jgi:hypothetical protein
VNFSCGNCGQKYRSADDPKPGHIYRVPCLVCDATVLVEGGDFPALPTAVADHQAARDSAGMVRAGGEEPLPLTLTHMVHGDPPPVQHRDVLRKPQPRRAVLARRWSHLLAGGGVAIATVGAGVLLLGGEPSLPPRLEAAPPRASRAVLLLGGVPSAADARAPLRGITSPARPPEDPRKPSPAPPPASRPAPVAEGPSPSDGVPPASEAPPAASSTPLTPEEVDAAVEAKRPAFDACLREMRQSQPGFQISGLAFDMLMTVNPSGIVTAPRVDDPALGNTVLGECFRDVARALVFPQFGGDPFEVRVPFRVGG